MKNLSKKELSQINGGGTSATNPLGFSLSVTSSVNSLLSLTVYTTFGDRKTENTLSIGNNINFGFIANGN